MPAFIGASPDEQRAMLAEIGARDMDELFAGLPQELQSSDFALEPGMSESQAARHVAESASAIRPPVNFCGGGFYDHYVPAAVDTLSGRGEFYTAYTPYQAEASQGTLQAIFEYQTAVARLMDMDAANASLYDGGTAVFEAVVMAARITGRRRVVIDGALNPIYRSMLATHTMTTGIEIVTVPPREGGCDRDRIFGELRDDTAAVVVQNPNFFGCIDDYSDIIAAVHEVGGLGVVSVYPLSLGLLRSPGEMGADIAVAEGQSLGLPLSAGGPYLGLMATRSRYVRRMPGRIVGMTEDAAGRRGFVLTLQAREQHIRREKATSNICTNEGLCALRAVIYLALLGRDGLRETAQRCAETAAYVLERIKDVPGVTPAFGRAVFNEFVLRLSEPAEDAVRRGLAAGVAVGSAPRGA